MLGVFEVEVEIAVGFMYRIILILIWPRDNIKIPFVFGPFVGQQYSLS